MVDVTPIVPTLAAVYTTSGTIAALSNEAMQEVNMTSLGYPRYTVYEIIDPTKRYLDKGVTPVFQADSGGDNNFKSITGIVEYAGGRIILAAPRGSSDVVRAYSANYFTTITKIMGASVSKLTNGPNLVEVPLLGDAFVRRYPTCKDFSVTVDNFFVLTEAEITTTADAANGHLTFVHAPGGTAGNSITVTLVNPGAPGALGVVVAGSAITINLAYAGGVVTSTALQVMAYVNSVPEVKALGVVANLKAGENGTGIMADSAGALTLIGGADAESFYSIYGVPLVVILYVNTTNDTRLEGYAYLESEGWTFDPKNVVSESLTFKGDGLLHYRPA